MRLNQVSISISRFGRAVPKDYPADQQHINIYSDSSDSVGKTGRPLTREEMAERGPNIVPPMIRLLWAILPPQASGYNSRDSKGGPFALRHF